MQALAADCGSAWVAAACTAAAWAVGVGCCQGATGVGGADAIGGATAGGGGTGEAGA